MSGHDKTPDRIDPRGAGNTASRPSAESIAPPSFGKAAAVQPTETYDESHTATESSQPWGTSAASQFDGPKSPWWETAATDPDTGPISVDWKATRPEESDRPEPAAVRESPAAPAPAAVLAPPYQAVDEPPAKTEPTVKTGSAVRTGPPAKTEPPAKADPPPSAPASTGRFGRRGRLMIGGGAIAAIIAGALAFAGIKAMAGPAGNTSTRPTQAGLPTGPQPSGSVASSGAPTTPSIIDSEKTDRRLLTFAEVFPRSRIVIGGRSYKQDKISVNQQCSLVARGAMAIALERGRCRRVVRATYVDGKKYAVTTGVAVMPTRAAALTANRAGDPSRYEWFRGMRGKIATNMDQAGGYASSTVRGRYIIYSYAQYIDDTTPQPDDPVLKNLTRQFIAYAVRPIDRRAQQ